MGFPRVTAKSMFADGAPDRQFDAHLVEWRVAAYGIVINDSLEVLLMQGDYSNNLYCPGGGVARSEKLLAGLARELREETGLEIEGEPELILTSQEIIYDPHTGAVYNQLMFFYACRVKGYDLNPQSPEGNERPMWVPLRTFDEATPGLKVHPLHFPALLALV